MATLICTQYPALAIHIPTDGSWVAFSGGRLEIEEGDANYEFVMAEASRNPAIAVYVNASTCLHCGETFAAKAKLEAHVKDAHFDKWLADEDAAHSEKRIAEVKARSGVICDACTPPGEYADEDALALHVKVVHAAAPELGDSGAGELGEGSGGEKPARKGRARPGEVES